MRKSGILILSILSGEIFAAEATLNSGNTSWILAATALTGILSATSLGLFSGFGFADGISSMGGQLQVQFIGVIAIFSYTAVLTFIILKLTSFFTGGLRVSEEDEISGLDIALHEERSYDI